jgi:HD-GYP domain-containing protein (c-di-GMP phosphodiesterase class II)
MKFSSHRAAPALGLVGRKTGEVLFKHRMDTSSQEFKISVNGLRVGMYVSRLDRPWLSTHFALEGFLVASEDDLRQIRRMCTYVWVDTTRGTSPDPRFIEFETDRKNDRERARREIQSLRKTEWKTRSSFEEEMPKAKQAHRELRQSIDEVMHDLHEGRNLQMDKLREGVEDMVDSITRNPTAFNWLKEIKRKDNYAYHHALACSVWAASFGRHLGLNRQELSELTLAGLLFDVGKTRVEAQIMISRKPYDDREHQTMRKHVQHGLDILGEASGVTVSQRILDAVATHHERHDGSGYPHGLKNGSIPMFGRILGLIDSYDAMTSIRPHMPSRSPHQAVMDLYESRDRLFQAELVEQFIQTSGIYPTGSLVELTDGQVGVVTAVHSLKRLRPTVMLLLDAEKRPLPEFRPLDLGAMPDSDYMQSLGIRSGLPQGAYGIDPAELFLD